MDGETLELGEQGQGNVRVFQGRLILGFLAT
jgi:hypothetical protein